MAKPIIVTAYDPTCEDLDIMREWLNLPKLVKISGRVRVKIPFGGLSKDKKVSMLEAYCGLLKILNVRYDYSEGDI